MTGNRLVKAAPVTMSGPPYGTQAWCDWRNTMMVRTDIEWVLDGNGGAFIRDKPEWSAKNMREVAQQHESERQKWAHRLRNPIKI
jgi:hypothetical protein